MYLREQAAFFWPQIILLVLEMTWGLLEYRLSESLDLVEDYLRGRMSRDRQPSIVASKSLLV